MLQVCCDGRRLTRRSPGGRVLYFALGAVLAFSGCKKNGPLVPLAPGLRGPVSDLMAIRAGNGISLGWTVPKKHIGKFERKGFVLMRVCRREDTAAACTAVGEVLKLAPGTAGTFDEQLPATLASGPARVLDYEVELLDRSGHLTGLLNSVPTLAGAPPPPIQGLTAERGDHGVILRWTPILDTQPIANRDANIAIIVRLHRFDIVPRRNISAEQGAMSQDIGAMVGKDIDVLDGAHSDHVIDTAVEPGSSYRYLAQQVVEIHVGDRTLEMAGQFSHPAEVTTAQITLK